MFSQNVASIAPLIAAKKILLNLAGLKSVLTTLVIYQ